MRGMICGLALLAATPAVAAEGVVACGDFRTAWAGALAKLDLAQTAPTYAAPDAAGSEAVQGLAGIEAKFTCREGIVGHVQVRAPGDLTRLDRAAAAILVGLDREMTPEAATATIAALRAEVRPTKPAASSWGPYELTLGRALSDDADELVLDLAEN